MKIKFEDRNAGFHALIHGGFVFSGFKPEKDVYYVGKEALVYLDEKHIKYELVK